VTKLKLKENEITAALPDDAPQIVAMSYDSIRTSGIPITPCFEKLCSVIDNAVLNEVCFVRRNKVNPKLIDGFLLLRHSVPEYSLDSIVYGLMFYIKPAFRSFSLARKLLNSAKEYGIIVRQPIVLDLFNQVDAEKKKKLLTYLGFTEVGSLYVFSPPARIDIGKED
jgi:hypothetical protein